MNDAGTGESKESRRLGLPSGFVAHRKWPWLLLMLAGLVIGVLLRCYQLSGQMLIDDEWHAVRMLIRSDATGIAGHFGLADYCIPLTLYYRWLYERGILNEWQMHLPLFLAGVALLASAPWMFRDVVALRTRAVWVALLGISPTLVYFSRLARPYALLAVLGPLAFVAFRAWHLKRSHRTAWAMLYVLTTFLAGWLHLLSLTFTLWPFVYYGVGALRACCRPATRASAVRDLGAMFALGLIAAAMLAAALAMPLLHDWRAMSEKAGTDSITYWSAYQSLQMQFGVANPWLCALMSALLVLGAYRLWRRDRNFTGLTLSATIVGIAVICAARPAWIQHPQVLLRYCAPILAFLTLYIAEGAIGVVGRIRSSSIAAALVAVTLACLFVTGPMPTWYYAPNQFMNHEVFQFDYDAHHNPYATLLQLGPVSAFYDDLAKLPPQSVTLIETPARAQSNFIPDPWLQKLHRQNVKFALASPVCGVGDWDEYPYSATAAHFDQMVSLQNVLAGLTYGADYLVLRLHPWTLPPGKDFPWPVAWPDMNLCVERVSASLGSPTYRDKQIVVFALSPKPMPARADQKHQADTPRRIPSPHASMQLSSATGLPLLAVPRSPW